MCDLSNAVYTLTLSRSEFITLKEAMNAANSYQRHREDGVTETGKRFCLMNENFQELVAIYGRLVAMDLEPPQPQPPIDMDTVNAAFDRIRAALSEADQAINHTKTTICLEEV